MVILSKPHLKSKFVNVFDNKKFYQDGNVSTIFKIGDYNPPILLFQQLPVKEKNEIIGVNRIRNVYIIDK